MKTLLGYGEYIIPSGATLERDGKNIIIRPSKRKPISDDRCRDCKFFGSGPATKTIFWKTSVCLKQPKREHLGTMIYKHVGRTNKICEQFERKINKDILWKH